MKNIMIIALLFISGCTSTPTTSYKQDYYTDPKRVEIVDRQKEKDLLSYLAKHMLDSITRKKLVARLNEQYIAKHSVTEGLKNYAGFSLSNDSTGMGLASLQVGLSLASYFYTGGSMEHVSGIAIPNSYDGIDILNKEQAWKVAVQHSENQLKKLATKFNMTLKCELWCDEKRRVYRFTLNDRSILSKYIYQPTGDIIVYTDWWDLVKVEKPDLLEAKLRGFIPAWSTKQGNTWLTNFFAEPVLDQNNKIMTKTSDKGISYPLADKNLKYTAFGRDLLRALYDDNGYAYSGVDSIYPGYFAFKGTLYSYITKGDRVFIKFELID